MLNRHSLGVLGAPLLVLLITAGTPAQSPASLECGFVEVNGALRRMAADAEAGLRPHRMAPVVPPRRTAPGGADGGAPVVTTNDFYLFEDSAGLLLTDFSTDDLIGMMIDAVNAMLVERGDEFDFAGYWVNFTPDHQIGSAFYAGVENDVEGIGDVLFNARPGAGIAGDHIEGFIMMWDINSSSWEPGTGSGANFTRLALAQEFEHRYAMFLPDLLDGRTLQGDNGDCGRIAHWNWKVDGQGSGMEISEWVGSSPAAPDGLFISFNTDIVGSVWSYTDLYLMGYVSPAEMDAGNSELRYLDTSDCSSDYLGAISTFSSTDIIATAGPRVPDDTGEDTDYRTGWIIMHLPGDEPDAAELQRAADILNQHSSDWSTSTLGRGSMDNTMPPPLPFQDLGENVEGTNGFPWLLATSDLMPGSSISVTLGSALENARAWLTLGVQAVNAPFAGGTLVPDIFTPPGKVIVFLTDGSGRVELSGTWPAGVPAGFELYLQYWIEDAGGPFEHAASNAVVGTSP